MSTSAQILANQTNSQLSTGPKTEPGKTVSSKNGVRHGLAAIFAVLGWESQDAFESLKRSLTDEFQPATPLEADLVQSMAEHRWLVKRALYLQDLCFEPDTPLCDMEKTLALYLRYQTTHERAYYKALHELQKLREQKHKSEIGFASQKQKEETHELKKKHLQKSIWLTEHRTLGQQLANEHTETFTLHRLPEKTMALETLQAA
jgi:hypothetical protein